MVKRSILFVTGCILIGVGLLGFVLPLFPGVVPFVIGIVLLSRSSLTVKRYIGKLKLRFPRQYEKLHNIREKLFNSKL